MVHGILLWEKTTNNTSNTQKLQFYRPYPTKIQKKHSPILYF